MNSKSNRGKRSEYFQIPESLRRLMEATATAGWVSAQELADEKAEILWSARSAASEKQMEELTGAYALRLEEKLALGAKLVELESRIAASDTQLKEMTAVCETPTAKVLACRPNLLEVKASAAEATQAAHGETANSTRPLKDVAEEVQRASPCFEQIARDSARLKSLLDAAQHLFAKIETAQRIDIAQCNCLEKHAIKGEGPTVSKLCPSLPLADSSDGSQLNCAVIAATRIILTAASNLQAISALSAAYPQPGMRESRVTADIL
jgi:chromosome segregation ATPase